MQIPNTCMLVCDRSCSPVLTMSGVGGSNTRTPSDSLPEEVRLNVKRQSSKREFLKVAREEDGRRGREV